MTEQIPIVHRVTPVDISGIRDPGVSALVLLASSLGWNVVRRPHNPILLVADDGTQKRIPTDTSIRISVFQTTLSTILLHTEAEPTMELVEEIVKATKLDRDHERRLRLAVDDPKQIHEERINNAERQWMGPHEPEEHLTHRVDEVLDAHFREVLEAPPEMEPTEAIAEEAANEYTPADEEYHGNLVQRAPLMARSSHSGTSSFYESDTSYERVWEDGYVDYECQLCGVAKPTSRGVGAHSQIHKRPEAAVPARWRATVRGRIEGTSPPDELEWVEPPQEQTVPVYLDEEPSTAQQTLDKVIQLVVPTILRERDRLQGEVIALRSQNAELRQQLEEIEGDFDALMELAANRRRPQTDKENP